MSSPAAAVSNPWLLVGRRNLEAPIRIFCFPFAGGGASVFQRWRTASGSTFELWPAQLPGRENRIAEAPFRDLEPLVAALHEALSPYLEPPFAFLGHSLGALVGYELTRRLRRCGQALPAHLFVSGRSAPHIPDEDDPVHDLPGEEFKRELERLCGTPREILADDELMELTLPMLRADFRVSETYRHQLEGPLPCPISVFGGNEDAEVLRSHMEAWREHTTGRFRLRMLDGNHFFLDARRDEMLEAVAADLAELAAAGQGLRRARAAQS